MTETEKAYIAGLFDGEGSIAVTAYRATKNGARYLRLYVRISNTDRSVLEWVRDRFGGGGVYLVQKQRPPWKPVYNFVAHGGTAKRLVLAIQPYLHIKRGKVAFLLAQRHSWRETLASVAQR